MICERVGLTIYLQTPNINPYKDPRWGRGQGNFSLLQLEPQKLPLQVSDLA